MSYTTPYDVYQTLFGPYHPDKPMDPPFSVWMGEQKQKYLEQFPERAKNQIDCHFYGTELTRFFQWISDTVKR